MKNKRILFEIAHPKHFHQFRFLMKKLREDGAQVKIIARDKDVVLDLLKETDFKYTKYGLHGKSIIQKLMFIPLILFDYLRVLINFRPHLIVSKSSPYAAVLAKMTFCKTMIMTDSEVVWLNNKIVAPLSDYIITPFSFALNYGNNHSRVSGLFEESYIGERVFKADKAVLATLNVKENQPYFLLRFVSWQANHDLKNGGFNDDQKWKLIKMLQQHGKVFISTEKKLDPQFQPYLLPTKASQIHHVLYFASLYIGDSQTMATEAALLGTPAIRHNTFVGKNDMSNFILLEKKFNLIRNAASFEDVCKVAEQWLANPALKEEWKKKANNYYSEKPELIEELYGKIAEVL